jgi:hypothetical protein
MEGLGVGWDVGVIGNCVVLYSSMSNMQTITSISSK